MTTRMRKISGGTPALLSALVLGLFIPNGVAHAQAVPKPAFAATSAPLLPHQAVYDLTLAKTRRNPAVDSVRGRIVYDFGGNVCDGYTTGFRQVSQIDGGEGRQVLSDLRSTTWEDGAGKSFRFKIRTLMNGSDASLSDGVAERVNGGVTVKLKSPVAKTIHLPGDVVFPTQQMAAIIAAAKAGKTLLELSVYDGSDSGEKVFKTLTVIGRPIGPGATPAKASAGGVAPSRQGGDIADTAAPLIHATRWPVTVSYYDSAVKPDSGEQTPVYTLSFDIYDNGVSSALMLDYNEFVLSGTMAKFTPHPVKPCR